MNHQQIVKDLLVFKDPQKSKLLAGFFKTGKGEYGEGDVFWGISVPIQRKVAKKYSKIDLNEVIALLKSKIHEHRLTALLILVDKYHNADPLSQKTIFNLYLKNTKFINNWDLVDLSSPNIVGDYLLNNNKQILIKLARSKNLWERRIAVLATFAFIKRNEFRESLKLAELLIHDKQDLMHKAIGWMLREIGKRNLDTEKSFLNKYYKQMPRTMLRYAIERFNEKTRTSYLVR